MDDFEAELVIVYASEIETGRHWRLSLAWADRADVEGECSELQRFALGEQAESLFFETMSGPVQVIVEPITHVEWLEMLAMGEDESEWWTGYKLIIFDADGTLRRCTVPGQPCPNRPGEWEVIPGVKETLAAVPWGTISRDHRCGGGGPYFAIASNQGGVGLGYMSCNDAGGMLLELARELVGEDALDVGLIQFCPHEPRRGCRCRKPAPGMLLFAMDRCMVKPHEVLMVGDRPEDERAAKAAGVRFTWAQDLFGGEMGRQA